MTAEAARIIRPADPVVQTPVIPHAQDAFLLELSARPVDQQALRRELRWCMAEIRDLRGQNRWDDIVALFHPVEEKCPELQAAGMATRLRCDMAFALGHLQRYEDAIAAYQACIAEDDANFQHHSGLAYTAYDSLYAALSRKVLFHPLERKNR